MRRHVVVLAPMPLEMRAITTAFGLTADGADRDATWSGQVGGSDVTAVHIGMGPELTRLALECLLESADVSHRPIDHVMNAGICGGLDPGLEVGTVINPERILEASTGLSYRHAPPARLPLSGTLITTEAATVDHDRSRRLFEEGCVAVDMESAAVAAVCEDRGIPWSIYRCIGDRWMDGLLDERVIATTNQDGSGNMERIARLIECDPQFKANLEQLGRDSAMAARLAAEAAVRGCLALDG